MPGPFVFARVAQAFNPEGLNSLIIGLNVVNTLAVKVFIFAREKKVACINGKAIL